MTFFFRNPEYRTGQEYKSKKNLASPDTFGQVRAKSNISSSPSSPQWPNQVATNSHCFETPFSVCSDKSRLVVLEQLSWWDKYRDSSTQILQNNSCCTSAFVIFFFNQRLSSSIKPITFSVVQVMKPTLTRLLVNQKTPPMLRRLSNRCNARLSTQPLRSTTWNCVLSALWMGSLAGSRLR